MSLIVLYPRHSQKTIPLHILKEFGTMVVIDELHGTNVHRSDITIEIKNYREPDVEQHEIIKKENPYQNGQLRKKGKGGYRKY